MVAGRGKARATSQQSRASHLPPILSAAQQAHRRLQNGKYDPKKLSAAAQGRHKRNFSRGASENARLRPDDDEGEEEEEEEEEE